MRFAAFTGSAPPIQLNAIPSPVPDDERVRATIVLRDLEGDALARGLDDVEAFARAHGLGIVERSPERGEVVVEATARVAEQAFGVTLEYFDVPPDYPGAPPMRYRAHQGAVHLPMSLHDVVEAVLGLDQRPHTRLRPAPTEWTRAAVVAPPVPVEPGQEPPVVPTPPTAAPAPPVLLPARRLEEHYNFPPGTTGHGQRIAILSFGGGFHDDDLRRYFTDVADVPVPEVSVVSVLGATNVPLAIDRVGAFVEALNAPDASLGALQAGFTDTELVAAQATMEVTMDVEIAGAVAPGAAIDVYFAPATADGWRTAIMAALGLVPAAPGVFEPPASWGGEHRMPTVISISWGDPEIHWSQSAMSAIASALRRASALGIAVCAASGDVGSGAPSDTGGSAPASVSFPASAPHVLACGGTSLTVDGDALADEVVWNSPFLGRPTATGGGVSGLFELPEFQAGAGVPLPETVQPPCWLAEDRASVPNFRGRGVPDVAALAGGGAAYRIHVGGHDTAGGGTSASTPLWAGLLARLGEALGTPVGFLTPRLYTHAGGSGALRPVVSGSNDVAPGAVAYFTAGPGWNACCGLGTPDGSKLLALLREAAAVGGAATTAPAPSAPSAPRPAAP